MPQILIAEDDAMLRDLIVMVLEDGDFTVSAHPDGAGALRAAQAQVPDAIVLDVAMPEMSGLEACRALRADPRTARVPVVMLTARGQWMDVAAGFDAGADDYMVKPFSPADLLHRLEVLLATHRGPRLAPSLAAPASHPSTGSGR